MFLFFFLFMSKTFSRYVYCLYERTEKRLYIFVLFICGRKMCDLFHLCIFLLSLCRKTVFQMGFFVVHRNLSACIEEFMTGTLQRMLCHLITILILSGCVHVFSCRLICQSHGVLDWRRLLDFVVTNQILRTHPSRSFQSSCRLKSATHQVWDGTVAELHAIE